MIKYQIAGVLAVVLDRFAVDLLRVEAGDPKVVEARVCAGARDVQLGNAAAKAASREVAGYMQHKL